MTVKEVAASLGYSKGFIYKEIYEGRLPARIRKGMKKGYVITEKDLDTWQAGFIPVK